MEFLLVGWLPLVICLASWASTIGELVSQLASPVTLSATVHICIHLQPLVRAEYISNNVCGILAVMSDAMVKICIHS